MNNTVSDEDISNCNASAVDEDATLLANGNSEVSAIECGQGSSILDARRVTDGTVDDVVGQDICQITSGEVGKSRADILESLARRSKNSNIGYSVNSIEEVGVVQSTAKGGEVGGSKSVRDNFRENEESVDNVNHTTSEVDILRKINI